jgi:heme exporter protein A
MFFAEMYRLEGIEELIAETSSKVGIEPRLDHRVRTLSHGFQKRVALARALMHEPQLLLLDEPESGLDSQSVEMLDRIIDEYRSFGRTVVMTTHIIEHALDLADRAVVLSGGRVGFNSDSPKRDQAAIQEVYTAQSESTYTRPAGTQ